MKNLDKSKREKRELNPMEEMILEDMNIVFENEVEKAKARKTRKETKKKNNQKQTQNYKSFKKGCDYLSLSAKYQSMGREIEDYRIGLYDLYDSYDSAADEENNIA